LQSTESKVQLEDLLLLAKGIASGMKFLASKKLIHRDLSARNVLVKFEDEKPRAKIADFGMSRQGQTGHYSSAKGTFPVKWSPPEVLEYEKYSEKSDVWAFAVTLWELFSVGKLPYMGMTNQEAMEFVLSGQRLAKPVMCPPKVFELMTKCWKAKAEERPDFNEILNLISQTTSSDHQEINLNAKEVNDDFYNTGQQTSTLYNDFNGKDEKQEKISSDNGLYN